MEGTDAERARPSPALEVKAGAAAVAEAGDSRPASRSVGGEGHGSDTMRRVSSSESSKSSRHAPPLYPEAGNEPSSAFDRLCDRMTSRLQHYLPLFDPSTSHEQRRALRQTRIWQMPVPAEDEDQSEGEWRSGSCKPPPDQLLVTPLPTRKDTKPPVNRRRKEGKSESDMTISETLQPRMRWKNVLRSAARQASARREARRKSARRKAVLQMSSRKTETQRKTGRGTEVTCPSKDTTLAVRGISRRIRHSRSAPMDGREVPVSARLQHRTTMRLGRSDELLEEKLRRVPRERCATRGDARAARKEARAARREARRAARTEFEARMERMRRMEREAHDTRRAMERAREDVARRMLEEQNAVRRGLARLGVASPPVSMLFCNERARHEPYSDESPIYERHDGTNLPSPMGDELSLRQLYVHLLRSAVDAHCHRHCCSRTHPAEQWWRAHLREPPCVTQHFHAPRPRPPPTPPPLEQPPPALPHPLRPQEQADAGGPPGPNNLPPKRDQWARYARHLPWPVCPPLPVITAAAPSPLEEPPPCPETQSPSATPTTSSATSAPHTLQESAVDVQDAVEAAPRRRCMWCCW